MALARESGAPASLAGLLEMQNLKPFSRHPESESAFHKVPSDSYEYEGEATNES